MSFYLKTLHIQNIATIQNQTVDFDNGFTVITGETGAGKSLLLKAMNLLLGVKASSQLIRVDHDFLLVEACFYIHEYSELEDKLNEIGAPCDNRQLYIKRIVYRNGKNQAYINHSTVKVKDLTQIAPFLFSLEGQHAQQELLKQKEALLQYNNYLKNTNLQESYTSLFQEYEKIRLAIDKHKQKEENAKGKQDFLDFQIQEIEATGFTQEEINKIQQEQSRLANADFIKGKLASFTDPRQDKIDLLANLQNQVAQLKDVKTIDSNVSSIDKLLEEALISYEEAVIEIQSYLASLDGDTTRLDVLNERLALLDKLKSKYGDSWQEIETRLHSLKQERESIEAQTTNLEEKEKRYASLEIELTKKAKELHKQRLAKQKEFNEVVTQVLSELGMEKSRFYIAIEETEKLGLYGKDQVSFQIATNAGMPLQPLDKIASGGELSRIMLGLKSVITAKEANKPLLFDEIDTGISGVIAQKLAQKLVVLSQASQVICITHSPQVAALGTQHIHLIKETNAKVSETYMRKLNKNERIEVIAGFLSGKEVTQETRKAASRLLAEHT